MKKIVLVVLVFILLLAMTACSAAEDRGGKTSVGAGTANGLDVSDATGSAEADTPADQMTGLTVGDSVSTNGIKITLNSVEDGPAASDGTETFLINVTYENYGTTMISASPFDWDTLKGADEIVGYDMDNKGSFNLITLPEGKQYTGNVILFKTDDPQGIVLKPTLRWSDVQAVWLIP